MKIRVMHNWNVDKMRYKRINFTPLKPLKNPNHFPYIIAFDTEDNGQGAPNNFICACFYSEPLGDNNDRKTEERTFFSRDEARKYMFIHRSDPATFFAHNLAYDITNLDYPENTIQQVVTHSKLICGLYFYPKKNKTRFMDTGNFFVGASIHSLGRLFNFQKAGCECEITNFDENTGLCNICNMFTIKAIKNKQQKNLPHETLKNCAEYCMQDSRICFRTAQKLAEMCNKHGAKFKSFTAGSLALRIFRTSFLKEEWPCRPQYINDFERTAYYGGRTEVFNYEKHDLVYYEDINSSYPTAMFHQPFPKPWNYTLIRNPKWDQIKKHHGISLVTVKVPKMRIPTLPYRRADNGKLIFPYGEWTASFTHPELIMAEKYGTTIKEVHHSMLYAETFFPFKEFIVETHALKSSSSGIERDFYKILMNSLSGKLGEKREVSVRVHEDNFKICYCNNSSTDRENKCNQCKGYNVLGQRIVPDENGWINFIGIRLPDPIHSFPVIISYITAYGRIKLFEDRLKYQDAIYCDTDSTVTTIEHNNERGTGLGKWECDIRSGFMAFVPKLYNPGTSVATGEIHKFKIKGVPKRHTFYYNCPNGHRSEFEICQICDLKLNLDRKVFIYEKPMRLSEAIHRRKTPNKWIVMEKSVSVFDSKREKLTNGDSEPLYIIDNDVSTFQELVKRYESI